MKPFILLIAIFFASQTMFAQSQKFVVKKNSNVSVTGTSSLHDWEGRVTQFEGDLTAQITEGKVTDITDFNFSFPVKSIRTGDNTMTAEMIDALKYKKSPEISYTFVNAEFIDNYNALLIGNMTIAGETKEIKTPVAVTTVKGEMTVSGSKTMLMTDFGIKPPGIILGLYKAKNEITIHYFIHLKKSRK